MSERQPDIQTRIPFDFWLLPPWAKVPANTVVIYRYLWIRVAVRKGSYVKNSVRITGPNGY